MCIAIANTQNSPLSDEELTNCWENNPDGAGILYKEDGKLKIYKQLTSLDAFKSEYNRVIKLSNCLVHFRVKSAGAITEDNIHPFMVHDNLGFIHNGTITKLKYDDVLSDTQLFNNNILKHLDKDFINNYDIVEMIEDYVGYSKMVFMDETEVFTIINERKGDWEGSNWFSNNSHKRVNNFYWQGNKKIQKPNSVRGRGTATQKISRPPRPSHNYNVPKYWYEEEEEQLALEQNILDEINNIEVVESDHPLENEWTDFVDELCTMFDQVPSATMETGDIHEIGPTVVLVKDRLDPHGITKYTSVTRELEAICKEYNMEATMHAAIGMYTTAG